MIGGRRNVRLRSHILRFFLKMEHSNELSDGKINVILSELSAQQIRTRTESIDIQKISVKRQKEKSVQPSESARTSAYR